LATEDWGKFGLLYLHNGNWNGERFLIKIGPNMTPTTSSNGRYGGHFGLMLAWLFSDAPKDMYYCGGFQGQMVAIIPSMDIVIVRMGLKDLILILMRC
jgi:CubicO group peptidase (beta-lactamase class C family)